MAPVIPLTRLRKELQLEPIDASQYRLYNDVMLTILAREYLLPGAKIQKVAPTITDSLGMLRDPALLMER